MEQYAYIMAGAGAAGLSLTYHLIRAGLADRPILLIDQSPKVANDRTWCFWEARNGLGDALYAPILFRRWQRVHFYSPYFSQTLDLSPYEYKMIQGADFYRLMDQTLSQWPNIVRRYGRVERIEDRPNEAVVHVDGAAYRGAWVFNSIPTPIAGLGSPETPQEGYHRLLQHFAGWVVATPHPKFDPSAATLMDFRIDQHGECRFCYVLPFDHRRALVEFTVFSPRLLPRDVYDHEIKKYLSDFLHIVEYQIEHVEFGVIPMTDAPFETFPGRRIVNIGTAGGCAKPSTGYTFLRIQHQAQQITNALKRTGRPHYRASPFQRRFGLYDSVLLNILEKRRYPAPRVFGDLFARNPAPRVLSFLDETSNILDELGVLLSTHYPPFIAATFDVTLGRLWQQVRR
ncbi:MAG: lycopene cyclase family protein [Anaerolineae bacterium]|nr:lycopene cyclase family protein [Thermoflexales bacterium]MDW8407032.1 lycopene cyclase family protein [Anaerolineae bacterium]